MPVPNDFRLNGALGGLVASQEYMAEQEKQQLANALTQAQTAGQQQQTGQLEALLPLLLEQRKQENIIRERQAGLAQATMGNIPQEAANEGLAGVLTGMQTQDKIASQPEESRIANLERKGKGLGLEQQNQLKALEQINYILKTQGNLAAASSASALGMNPEVLFKDPTMIGKAIDTLKTQMKDTPTFRQDMSKAELDSRTKLESSRITADASKYGADKSAGAREAEATARREAQASALSVEKRFTEAEKAYIAAGRPAVGPVAEEYAAAHNAWTWKENMRQPATSYFDPDTGEIRRETPASRPAPARLTPQGSGGNPQAQGSSGARIRYDAQGRRITQEQP
jgi:hypothetical protein